MKRMQTIVFIIMTCLLLSILATGCGKQAQQETDIPSVKAMRVGIEESGDAVNYAGEVKGRYESQLAFQVGGKIITRNINLGDRVSQGDILLAIDAKDVAQSANIGAAQVESARAQLSLAEANLNRYRQLYEQEAVSLAQYEQYKTTYDSAVATLKQAEAQAVQGSNALGYSRLLSDGDGVISAINAEVGQVVAAGQSIVTLVKSGELEVEINVPENRLKDVQVGQTVTASFWALENVTAQGTIREISPMADKTARTYKVRVSLDNPPAEVSLGMTANIVIKQENRVDKELVIPLTAIFQTGDTPNVWVIEEEKVRLQPIVIENFGDNSVKVLSGIKQGETIVIAGVHKLHDGQMVRQLAGEKK